MMRFFEQFPEIFSVMSLRADCTMRVWGDSRRDRAAHENRKKFFALARIPSQAIYGVLPVHGTRVVVIEEQSPQLIADTDALITTRKNIFLSVTAADCFVVLFYDPIAKIVGVAHVGWRGVVANIVVETIRALCALGAHAENLHVAIAPGISQANFTFDYKEFIKHFGIYRQDKFVVPSRQRGMVHVSLQGIIVQQLRENGITKDRITSTAECTYAHPEKYFSYRRDKPKDVEAMIVLIGMRE